MVKKNVFLQQDFLLLGDFSWKSLLFINLFPICVG